MKRIATLYLLLLVFLTVAAHAQPQVSYMIPDIGAAGMNTYVEIIGPTGTTGNFGSSDDIFLNVQGDAVRVMPVTPGDTTRVLIGPVVVSWGGRMISTQIFVRPGAATGTVFLQVVVNNGTPSAPIPFDIVTPQTLGTAGTLSGGGALGSGGALGTRSKRGAMIVNSLTLQSGTFSVSTNDPDNLTAGNQGYLPFILLSKGPVRVQSGVVLNVNGTTGTGGTGGNGGPGGGGGGGGSRDVISGNSAPSGGDGFTGGGPGAVNRSIGGNGWGSSGMSSGSNPTTNNATANALNGATGGMSSWSCAEDAGGGTGHPFGTGGVGSCPGTSNAAGGYGGGSGTPQNTIGGGGGYGGVGGNGGGSSGSTSAGKVHGNDMAVPVAGGSGGASGNPQGINATSGGGGGGGGALVLYSMADMVNSGTLEARGATGGSGSPNGGSGSGGLVEIGTKVRTTNGGTANVTGGAASGGLGAGGFGRFRADGFGNANAPTTGTRYAGPSIDSMTYVQSRTFTLQGTYNGGSGVNLRLYMKSDNSPGWTLVGAPTVSGTTWSMSFTATAGAGNYYFVVAQGVPTSNSNQYDAQPKWILSQAAANIVTVQLTAKINTDKTVDNFADLVCETERIDSVKVWNSGDDILRVTPSLALNNQGFTLVSPTAPFTLAPDSSLYVKIRFVPTAPGTKADTLVLANNDLRPGMNPKKVTLIAKKLNIRPYFDKADFDFGEVCKDSTITRTIWFHYTGDVQGVVNQPTRIATGQSSFTLVPLTGVPRTINSGDSIPLTITFHPTTSGLFTDQFEVLVGPCNQKVAFSVRATGTFTQVLIVKDTIKFGDVRINVPSLQPFSVINTGTASGRIDSVYIVPPDPAFQITVDPKGTTLFPTQQAGGTIRFLPTEAKDYQVKIYAIISGNCPDTTSSVVTGRGVTSLLFLSRKEITISADKCSDPAPTVTDTFKLYNLGTAGAPVDAITSLHGLVNATTTPALGRTLDAHDSMTFTITWTPGTVGTQYDTLKISTQSEDPKQREILLPLVLQRDKWDVTIVRADNSTLPAEVDLGNLFSCTVPALYNLLLKNLGTVNDTAVGGMAKGTDFTLTPAVLPYTVDAGTAKALTITFGTTVQGTYRDTLTIRSTVCAKEIKVPFVASFFDIKYDAPDVDYGKKNVGFPSVKPVSVTNTSTMPNNVHYHIIRAEIHPPTAPFALSAPISYPQEIAPGESFSQNVTFTPPAVGDYSGELWYIIDGPCPDTIKVPLKGTGIQSNVLVQPSALNFGTKYLCQDDSVLVVTVKNTGLAAFDLQGLNIDGIDQAAYELTKSPSPLPSSIPPGGIDTLVIHFMPSRAGADGLLRAVLHIKTNDPTNPEVTVDLIGERRRQVLTTPSILDFGKVEVGEKDTLEVTFQNRTTDTLTIDNLSIGPPFEVLDQQLPIRLGPAGSPTDSIRIKIRFTPVDTTQSELPLIIAETSPCVDTASMTVRGQGKITPVGTADIVIPLTVTGKPGQRVAIPIIMEKTLALDITGATTFEAKIRFNKTLLKPLGARSKGESIKKGVVGGAIEGGSMTKTQVIGHDMVASIRITNVPIPLQPDTLGFLDALVMLGDASSTPLTIDTLYWTDGLVRGTTSNGLFSLSDYCTDGGERLINASGQFGIKSAVPNPFNPSTEISFQTVEAGETTLAIYDSYGRLIDLLIDRENLPISAHSVTWYANGASSGLYYAVLMTPTERSVYPLMLVK